MYILLTWPRITINMNIEETEDVIVYKDTSPKVYRSCLFECNLQIAKANPRDIVIPLSLTSSCLFKLSLHEKMKLLQYRLGKCNSRLAQLKYAHILVFHPSHCTRLNWLGANIQNFTYKFNIYNEINDSWKWMQINILPPSQINSNTFLVHSPQTSLNNSSILGKVSLII